MPLNDESVRLLMALDSDRSGYVFATPQGRPFGTSGMYRLTAELAPGSTVHGWRSTFRDWAGDRTTATQEVAEKALAHNFGSATERAYRRGDALNQRRALMAEWAAYLGQVQP